MTASSILSVVSGSGIAANVFIGVESTVSVQARDTYGVVTTNSDEIFHLKIDYPESSTNMIYSGDSYKATYTPLLIGKINVSVWIKNIPVRGLLANYFPTEDFSGAAVS